MDHDAELVDVVTEASAAEARRAVEALLDRGIGATVTAADGTEAAGDGGLRVQVVAADAARARSVLGIASPSASAADSRLTEARRQRYLLIGLFAAAFVLVPLAGFWIAYLLAR
jgi:hypothetical protein